MKIITGSGSKRKIDIVEKVARQILENQIFEVSGYAAKSGVPETPYDKETFDGARNRAIDSRDNVSGADYYIGLESGLIERYGHIFEEAWCVVLVGNKEYYGYSSGLKVPDFILEKMEQLGKPHSEVMGLIEEEFTKTPSDTWGTYSGGLIAREVSLEEAVRNALLQLVETEDSLYQK